MHNLEVEVEFVLKMKTCYSKTIRTICGVLEHDHAEYFVNTFYFNNAFQYAVRPLVTARASDSMFYPLTMCTLQIVFMIMIIDLLQLLISH